MITLLNIQKQLKNALLKLVVLSILLVGSNLVIAQQRTAVATFAGGCFWCMEPPYDKLEGVISTTSGYIGGNTMNPTYEEVSAGGTGHYEVVQVEYNPAQVNYGKLLDVFWRNIDPLDGGGQFCDRGSQYLSAIFYHNDEQRTQAEASREALADSGQLSGKIQTEIIAASEFYPAEEYHQNYYDKNPIRYRVYRFGCRRDARLDDLWGES